MCEMSTSKSIFFSESMNTISSPSLMERCRHCLTVHAAISNSSTFIQETTFWIWGVAMVRLPSLLAFLVRLLLIYTFPNRRSSRTHPLMRWYVHWRTGIDIGARPEDTLHPDYSKLHLNGRVTCLSMLHSGVQAFARFASGSIALLLLVD